jgi:hypothetical protein
MTDHILIERAGESGALNIIRFNRPEKKNAITRAMYSAMARALIEGDRDEAVRVHVMLGTPGAFTSGNDMQDFMAVAMGGSMGTEVLDFLAALATAKKPLVSGVDGLAIGVGTTIHMHCDLTFATAGIAFPHTVCRSCACARGWLEPAGAGRHGASAGVRAAGRGHSRSPALKPSAPDWSSRLVPAEELEAEQCSPQRTFWPRKPPQGAGHRPPPGQARSRPVVARMREEAESCLRNSSRAPRLWRPSRRSWRARNSTVIASRPTGSRRRSARLTQAGQNATRSVSA